MRLAVLFFCCALAFGQSAAPAPYSTQKSQTQDKGVGDGAPATNSVLAWMFSAISRGGCWSVPGGSFGTNTSNWFRLVPESGMKKGRLAIEFAITKDGHVADMRW
jgi:hypothetical protein